MTILFGISEPVAIAAIFAVPSVIAPLLLAVMNSFLSKRSKQEDWDRQDALESRLTEKTDKIEKTAEKIHVLVNSNMTAAMQSELDATIREVAMMREVIAMREAAGHKPSQEAMTAISVTESKIKELKAELAQRHKNNIKADTVGS